MPGAFLTSFRYAPGFEPVGIEARLRPPYFDEVSEDQLELIRILYDGDDIGVVPQD